MCIEKVVEMMVGRPWCEAWGDSGLASRLILPTSEL
jgi:hypothetical protein